MVGTVKTETYGAAKVKIHGKHHKLWNRARGIRKDMVNMPYSDHKTRLG